MSSFSTNLKICIFQCQRNNLKSGILYGSNILPYNANIAIFEAVHNYIKESKRF